MKSNVTSRRSSWVKVKTVTPKPNVESTLTPDKEELSQRCSYCGEQVSPKGKICESCGTEI